MVSVKEKKTKKVKVKDDISDEVKDSFREHAKFYQQYDVPSQWKNQPIACKEPNLDPFKKINWKNLWEADQKGRLFFKKTIKLFGVIFVRKQNLVVELKMLQKM
jgi:hypothetical protein